MPANVLIDYLARSHSKSTKIKEVDALLILMKKMREDEGLRRLLRVREAAEVEGVKSECVNSEGDFRALKSENKPLKASSKKTEEERQRNRVI
ncbi:hypothetical protein O9G_006195 [Rozella allomycis CSF55]|uniref:Uncharacterized protein n=1 Tax=Rozella allomycis (strain CSF55) TaxID=988480 RepID=A0A075AVS5_ROZAC|nr:hypothetical protein O9G_006195 [Rozella allomycis CSF55]|eukprot:EPZ32594.1 hypothetical protein O9G_006195 [Rozella allomycis CSF55]